jgi:hypothetical protein
MLIGLRIEQSMQVHDEIAHVSIVDRLLRLGSPYRMGRRVIRENADEIQLFQIAEFDLLQVRKLASEDEMQQLRLSGALVQYCLPTNRPWRRPFRSNRRSDRE